MDIRSRRRALLQGLAALAVPAGSFAQPRRAIRRIGYLSGGEGAETGLAQALEKLGWTEGRSLRYEIRKDPDAAAKGLASAAAELVRIGVDLLLAWGTHRVQALALATRTIPIVCGGCDDPVGSGFARSLARPGGNITGLSFGLPERAKLIVGVFRSLRPKLRRMAVLVQDLAASAGLRSIDGEVAAAGVVREYFEVRTLGAAEKVIAALDPARDVVIAPGFAREFRAGLVALAISRRVVMGGPPAREGGLVFFLLEHAEPERRLAQIIDKVLRGANPGEIPFELPDRTVFEVNRATARAIGIELPPEILLRATKVID